MDMDLFSSNVSNIMLLCYNTITLESYVAQLSEPNESQSSDVYEISNR
jgi:hypothetical protein